MDTFSFVLIVFVLLLFMLGVFVTTHNAENRQKMESLLDSETTIPTEHFHATDKFIAKDGESGIAIDTTNCKFALLHRHSKSIVDYGQIVLSEVCIDSETIISTDRLGQVGGAMLGGALTGGVGALIMALGAKKKQTQHIRRVELKVLVTGGEKSTHTVLFSEGAGSGNEGIKGASKWHDLLTVAIREHGDYGKASARQLEQPQSLADELNKLVDLMNRGLLTDEEFKKAKAALL